MKKRHREFKILILGSELSGKTTFFKQMQISHGTNPSLSDRKSYSLSIIRAIFLGIQRLIKIVQRHQIGYENSDLEGKSHEIMLLDVNTMEEFENRHFEIVKDLCNDLAIAAPFSEEKERLVEYNLDYFLCHIDRIFEPNYIPTQEDILHIYIPTKRTIEFELDRDKMKMRKWPKCHDSIKFIDMGGLRSERRKWIHCFKQVGAIVFLASLSEYDQMMYGNQNITRLEESIALFQTVMDWFEYSSFILFLNKIDIFKQKVMYTDSHLSKYYSDFDGPEKDEIAAKKFILSKFYEVEPKFQNDFFDWKESDARFLNLNKKINERAYKHRQEIYAHHTCMIDSTSIPNLVVNLKENIKDMVLWKNLEMSNLS